MDSLAENTKRLISPVIPVPAPLVISVSSQFSVRQAAQKAQADSQPL